MNIAVVEDDVNMRKQLLKEINRYFTEKGEHCTISSFADGDEILEEYAAVYDVIFLDIKMKRLDGMQTAQRIRQIDENVALVFVTNLASYALQGYSVGAVDYILKPVNALMIDQTLARVERMLARKEENYIVVSTNDGLVRLAIQQIYYVEADNHAALFHCVKGSFHVKDTLKNIEEKLAPYSFFRCNNCYLINLAYVERIDKSNIIVGGHELTISRPRYKAFMETLTKYMGV